MSPELSVHGNMVVMTIMIMMMLMISAFKLTAHLTTASYVQFLIMCCIVFGNQKIIQLVKKSPACDGNRRFKADSHIACRAHAAFMPFPCHAVPLRV